MTGIFSVGGQMNLRALKRTVTGYVESHLPPLAVTKGVTVLVMEVACNKAGCVPVETSVMVLFPGVPGWNDDGAGGEIIPSAIVQEGKYTTAVLKPMSEVTRKDVTDALPPQLGGRFTALHASINIRDALINNVEQTFGGNRDDKVASVDFIIAELLRYKNSGFVVPEEGVVGLVDEVEVEVEEEEEVLPGLEVKAPPKEGNFIIKRQPDKPPSTAAKTAAKTAASAVSSSATTASPVTSSTQQPAPAPAPAPAAPSAEMKARQIASMNAKMNKAIQQQSSMNTALSALSAREHAPGVRRRGCPCCDPDDPENLADGMMML
jgi:hypothetical protein